MAVGISKCLGAEKVITSASKPAAIAWLKQTAKADVVIDYSKKPVVAAVLAATGGRGVDVVYDSTYLPSSYEQSVACLAPGGTLILLVSSPAVSPALTAALQAKQGHLVLCNLADWDTTKPVASPELPRLLRQLAQWVTEGKLHVYVEKVKLEEVIEGLKRLEQGKFPGGKIAVQVVE